MGDATEAREALNGTELDGRKIRVDYSITKRAHTPTPGMYMGRPTSSRDRDRGGRGRDGYRRDDWGYGGRRDDFRGGDLPRLTEGGEVDHFHLEETDIKSCAQAVFCQLLTI